MGPMSKDFCEKVTHLGGTPLYALTFEYPPALYHSVQLKYCKYMLMILNLIWDTINSNIHVCTLKKKRKEEEKKKQHLLHL